VTIADQTNSPNTLFSYFLPKVSSVSLCSPVGGWLYISGTEFGSTTAAEQHLSVSILMRKVELVPDSELTVACSQVVWFNSTYLKCFADVSGVGERVGDVIVILAGLQSDPGVGMFGFQPPQISKIYPLIARVGDTVTITGLNFGTVLGAFVTRRVTLGGFECSVLPSGLLDTALECIVGSGGGEYIGVNVWIGSQAATLTPGAPAVEFTYLGTTDVVVDECLDNPCAAAGDFGSICSNSTNGLSHVCECTEGYTPSDSGVCQGEITLCQYFSSVFFLFLRPHILLLFFWFWFSSRPGRLHRAQVRPR
jgi:hypothetical protein